MIAAADNNLNSQVGRDDQVQVVQNNVMPQRRFMSVLSPACISEVDAKYEQDSEDEEEEKKCFQVEPIANDDEQD